MWTYGQCRQKLLKLTVFALKIQSNQAANSPYEIWLLELKNGIIFVPWYTKFELFNILRICEQIAQSLGF